MEKVAIVAAHLCVLLGTAALWELVAWSMHRWVMHGFGWFLHEDHHRTTGRRLQKNDLYALFFALVSFLLIFLGLRAGLTLVAAAGLGVALYGVCYVLFHDVLFHRRIPGFAPRARGRYLKALVAAHRVHHATNGRDGARNFSFLWPAQAPANEGVKA
jgi:beta-carotene 3-hydroxylase